MYAIPIWTRVLKMSKNKKITKSAQKMPLTRTSTVYRTVSHAALCALTDNMLIHNKARMRAEIYKIKRRN